MLEDLRKGIEEHTKNIEEFRDGLKSLKQEYSDNTTFSSSALDAFNAQYPNISSTFEPEAPVFVTRKMDSILDFINSCDENTKNQVLEALKSSTADKALFLTSVKDDEKTYVVLMNINSLPEEAGLALAYSTSVDTLSYFLAELTTLTEDDIKQEFEK
jgi:pentose-5-phosphate-3-epimerase